MALPAEKKARRTARAEGTVDYCYALLKPWDNYGSGNLEVCAREITRVIPELHAKIDELLARGSELENERRGWKARAEAAVALLSDVLIEVPLYEREKGELPASELAGLLGGVKAVALRSEMLESDAWCKSVALVRDFLTACETPMGDYAPQVVRPIDGYDAKSAFIARWLGLFKAALK